MGNLNMPILKKQQNRADKILFYFVYLSLFIDILSGAIVYYTGNTISLGQLIKTPILFLLILRILQKKDNSVFSLYIIVFMVFISLNVALNCSDHKIGSIFIDLFTGIKPLFLLSIFFWMREQIQSGWIDNRKMKNLIDVNIGFIILNQLLGIFGLGYPSYNFGGGTTIGTSGFFFSGNEYAILLMLVFSLKLFFIHRSSSISKYVFWSLFLIGVAATTAIKTAILGTILMSAMIPISANLRNSVRLIATCLICILFVGYAFSSFTLNSGFLDRSIWVYQNKGLTYLILSGRDIMLHNALEIFQNQYSWIEQLFGIGYSKLNQLAAHPEMDMFDILFMYGAVGLIIIYIPFVFVLTRHIKPFKRQRAYRYVTMTTLIILSISFFAGHLIFSVAVAPFIAIIMNQNTKPNESFINL